MDNKVNEFLAIKGLKNRLKWINDNLEDTQLLAILKIVKLNGNVNKIHDKFSLLSYLNLKSTPYEETGVFNIWHFSLDENNIGQNYGVYANGLLVEACPYEDITNPKFPITFKE